MSPRRNPTRQYGVKAKEWAMSAPIQAAIRAYENALRASGTTNEIVKFGIMVERFWHSFYPDPLTEPLLLWAVATLPRELHPPAYRPKLPRGSKRSDFTDPSAYRRPQGLIDIPFEAFANLFPFGATEYDNPRLQHGTGRPPIEPSFECPDAVSVAGRIEQTVAVSKSHPYHVHIVYLGGAALEMARLIETEAAAETTKRARMAARKASNQYKLRSTYGWIATDGIGGLLVRDDILKRPFLAVTLNNRAWFNDTDVPRSLFFKPPVFMQFKPADEAFLRSTPLSAFVINPWVGASVIFDMVALPLNSTEFVSMRARGR